MRLRLRSRRAVAGAAVVALACALTACGGGGKDPLSNPGDKPTEIDAPAKQVEVCSLVTPRDVRRVLQQGTRQVALEYGAAQVPTLACGLGQELGVATVTIQLATGPISLKVFDDAYGDGAGGDPEVVKKLGELAFLRNEEEQFELHALVNGAIMTLNVAIDAADPVDKVSVVDLARLAATRLPANPRLAPTAAGSVCGQVPLDGLTAAIGSPPSVASSLKDADGSMMCSWSARPGNVVVTIVRSPGRIKAYKRLVDDSLYTTVEGVDGPGTLQVVSRSDKAGDLLMFDGDDALAVINVIPTAGFSGAEIATTPGELTLASGVAEALL